MKNNFLVLVSLFVSLNMLSQSMTNDQTTDNVFLSSKTTPVFKGYKNTMGSIYANKEFQIGSVYKNGKMVASNVALRYNVQAEEIELKANTSTSATVANVIQADQNISVSILNDEFVYLVSPDKNQKAGYFMVIAEGSKLTIYKKIIKDFVEGKESANSYSRDVPDTFKEKEQLYIVSSTGGLTKLPKGKAKREKLFAPMVNQMSTYIENNNLNLRREKDFNQALAYFNAL
ncbi:hypothetical protein N9P56_02020 [Flavobacteriaceae bacterium]|nr:hypothetical protein [Flavobacteriaceae bacterium]MDB4175909.1 hypothetical protein [Flavobacteriaceae bacterium]